MRWVILENTHTYFGPRDVVLRLGGASSRAQLLRLALPCAIVASSAATALADAVGDRLVLFLPLLLLRLLLLCLLLLR